LAERFWRTEHMFVTARSAEKHLLINLKPEERRQTYNET